MKKRDVITLVVLAIIFLFIFAIILLNNNNEEDTKNKTEFNSLSLLTDENIFLSVSNNINKAFEYATSNVIALNYIMKTEVNIKNYKNVAFKAEQIYVVSKLSYYKYYVKGSIYKEQMDQTPEFIKESYFILNYDMSNTSYNIEEIDKKIYDNASNDEYIFEKIDSNNYNKFIYSSLSPKSRALMYFNDFLNKMYNDIDNAYNLLSTNTKNNFTLNEFKEFISNHNNISIVEFSDNGNKIGIKDNYNTEYIFEISYVLKYTVDINITES